MTSEHRLTVITGASGFIGGRVARMAAGTTPTRLVTGNRPPPGDCVTARPAVEHTPVDLAAPGRVRGLLRGADTLVHCASRIRGTPDECEAVNVHGTRALVDEAHRAGVSRIVYLSTASVYGRGVFRNAAPQELAPAPQSDTSRTRATAERIVLSAGGIVVRPYLVHGAGDQWVGPAFARLARALRGQVDGWAARLSVIDADDLARVILALARAPLSDLTARVYHANHPRPVLCRDFMDAMASVAGVDARGVRYGYQAAADRLRTLGESTHALDMIATDHWFDSEPVWQDANCDPGPGFGERFVDRADWYRHALAGRI